MEARPIVRPVVRDMGRAFEEAWQETSVRPVYVAAQPANVAVCMGVQDEDWVHGALG